MTENRDELIIVLHIHEGINFHSRLQPLLVTASLDKNILETPIAQVNSASTILDSNLVWETDRKSIKRMKSENLPIKIECFSIDQSKSREPIGHLIIQLKSIPVLPVNRAKTVKPRWYRLIGLALDWRVSKPELFIVVMITDKAFLEEVKPELVQLPANSNESIMLFDDPDCDMLTSQHGIFIKLLQNRGLLQVGNVDTDCDVFLVKLIIKSAKFLDVLLNDSQPTNQEFSLKYKLLGKDLISTLEKKTNLVHHINEKIIIHFRTSLKMLNEYFDKIFAIPIEIHYANRIVGVVTLKLANIIQTLTLENYLAKYSVHENVFETEDNIYIMQTDRNPDKVMSNIPTIKFKYSMKYVETEKNFQKVDSLGGGDVVPGFIGGDSVSVAGGPQGSMSIDSQAKSRPSTSRSNWSGSFMSKEHRHKDIQPQNTRPKSAVPQMNPPEKTDIETILRCEDKDIRDVPRTFSYNIVIQSAKFNRRPDNGIWQLSFQHQKADTPYTKINIEFSNIKSETVDFNQTQMQLYFSSLPENVLETIISDTCRLTINGPHGLYAFAELDNQSLVVGHKEKKAGVILLESPNGESVAMANIFVYLDDIGINYNTNIRKSCGPEIAPVSKPQLDEQLAYKIVEELENWKAKQQEAFLIELKKKEAKLLSKLSAEWKKKRQKDEKELVEKLEQCSELTAALEETQRTLKEKGLKRVEQEKIITETEQKLKECYENQVMAIRHESKKVENEILHQLQIQQSKTKEVEVNLKCLEKENDKLRDIVSNLEDEIERLKQNRVTKQSLSSLYHELKLSNERYEDAIKSKLFYKQQWAKSIREIHKIQMKNMGNVRNNLILDGNVGLRDYLSEAEDHLANEKDELEEVRRLIFN